MDENKIKELWQSSNEILEQSLSISKKNAEDITKLKVHTLLSSMKPIKIFTLLVGILWVGIGGTVVINLFINSYEKASPFFLYSAAIQLFLTAIALFIYLYQLVLLQQVDISEPVIETQNRLANLKSSTLWVTRFLFLQLPVWTTFFLNKKMFISENIPLLIFNGLVTMLFIIVAVWLFINIKYENKDKKWFKLLFAGQEWTPVVKSIELSKEIQEFKQDK
ncbi:MAG: hypothetical protein ABL929_10910 [Ferruginibacter sp.]